MIHTWQHPFFKTNTLIVCDKTFRWNMNCNKEDLGSESESWDTLSIKTQRFVIKQIFKCPLIELIYE